MQEEIAKKTAFDETKLMGDAATWYREIKDSLKLVAAIPAANELIEKIQAALMETNSVSTGDGTPALEKAQALYAKLSGITFDVPYSPRSITTTVTH